MTTALDCAFNEGTIALGEVERRLRGDISAEDLPAVADALGHISTSYEEIHQHSAKLLRAAHWMARRMRALHVIDWGADLDEAEAIIADGMGG